MEYVSGLDLSRMVKAKGPMPVRHACYFVHEAAPALDHAHRQGLVHRDIKPGNLMLSHEGNHAVIKLLDFGAARIMSEQDLIDVEPSQPNKQGEAAENPTLFGQIVGTPAYMAPEQIDNSENADIRADIYSLGCTLYFLLSGHPPFRATTIFDILQAQRLIVATPLNFVRPEVPLELAALAARMMAKDPAEALPGAGRGRQGLIWFFKKSGTPHPRPPRAHFAPWPRPALRERP